MALVAFVQVQATASPGDIFSIAAPALTADQPKAAALNAGDASVSTQTGALTYSYPINVPPGRHGMQPALGLTYSSQAPIYGTVASGWSIAIPTINLDTSNGLLANGKTKVFTSSMAGGRPMVPITETLPSGFDKSYRAQNDASFTRYLHRPTSAGNPWVAQTTDGVTYNYAQSDHLGIGAGCTHINEDNAPLTSMTDAFGNVVDYYYFAGVPGECRIAYISWGQNANAAIGEFARVTFNYATSPFPACNGIPVGSQTSYRTSVQVVTGASQLNSLTITAAAPGASSSTLHTRQISLAYSIADASCTASHAAFRSLTSIQESAWFPGTPAVVLPAVTFTYGAATPTFVTTTPGAPWRNNWGGLSISSALSWGQRWPSVGKWPTVEAMLVDIDGDGLLDRVTNDYGTVAVGNSTYTTKCGMSWERNPGQGLQFEAARHIDLPTLKWGSPANDPYAGGSHTNINGTENELCALNYQQTSYLNSHGNAGTDLGCQPGATACPASGFCGPGASYGNDCGQKNGNVTTILAYRWIDIDDDGKVDLVASIAQGGLGMYNLQWGNGVAGHIPAQQEPTLFGTFPACPTPYSDGSATNLTYTMCNGMYPWFVYQNHGGGAFGKLQGTTIVPDTILYQPVALETTTGDSTISGRVVGTTTANVDLDGDGHSDEVQSTGNPWTVFRGLPKTSFQPALPFTAGGTDVTVNLSTTTVFGASEPITTTGLFDLNGDGLLDRWSGTSSTASFEINTAYGFSQNLLVSALRPGNDGRILATNCTDVSQFNGFLSDCTRFDSSRTVDVDGDGRSDLVQLPGRCIKGTACVTNADCGTGNTCANANYIPGVNFNEGGQFSTAPVVAGVATALDHKMQTSSAGGVGINPYTWAVRSDMIDLDGDGIVDGITTFGGDPPQYTVARASISGAPPRLLTQIDNGRGAVTTVAYAPLSDPSVVTLDWRLGKVSPRPQWVVKRLATVDNFDAPITTSTSTVTYKYPVYNRNLLDDQDHYALRGFEEATTTGPTGAKMVDRYGYTVDWRGVHTQALIYPTETPSNPTSIVTTTWESRALFNGVLQTFHPTISDHLTCAAGQTEDQCTPDKAAGFSRTTTNMTPCGPGACDASVSPTPSPNSQMWLATRTLLQAGTSPANGDRRVSTAFNVYAPAATLSFRTRSTSTIQEFQTGGVWTLYGKKAQGWDAAFLTPTSDEIWVDSVDGNRSVTQRTYDPVTGNVMSRRKPIQTDANGPSTTYDYDSRKLFVSADHYEPAGYYNVSQEVDYVYEYGTGTKIETKGPNIASCSGPPPYTAPTCPTNTSFMEDTRIQIDALGRTIDRWETFAPAWSSSYYTIERERDTYFDGAPSSMTTLTAYDFDQTTFAPKFMKNETDLDGRGRTIRKVSYSNGAAPADAVTTFTYNSADMIASVSVPDPTLNTTATVSYTYAFDSLGRPTSIRRPDSTTVTNQSGANISYSGMTATSTEVVGAALGQVAITTSTRDSFGRLTKLEETIIGTTQAATTYAYDAADNVVSVVDPTGITTTMVHDFAGHRTQIARGGPTWKYTYDKNGNLWAETFPGSTSSTIQNYVNTIVYDNLDRPSGKTIGQRDLLQADKAAFGAGYESTLWDFGANASGRLGVRYSYAPSASQPTTWSQYVYDLAGHEQYTSEGFSGLTATPVFLRHHTLLGNVQDTYYCDYPAADRATLSLIQYDARGLPSSIQLSLSTSTPLLDVAAQTRNVAGLVTKRHTDVTGSPMTFTESNWTYDKLSRVASQVVQDGPGPTQVARQDLAYFGNDDPKTLDQWLGPTNHKHFTYGYDLRHELTSVGETLLPNAFTAAYTFNSAGRFTSATESAVALPNSEVKPRNVTYQYSGSDPEQVTALVNTNTTIAWAYTYDASGNQTMQCSGQVVSGSCTGASETDYLYDGNDRLRRATKKAGGAVQGSEEYWYDGHGNRNIIAKRNSAGTVTETTWFIGDTEAHYDGFGNWVHSYADVSLGTPVARVDTDSSLAGKVEYQFHGLANNTLAAIDKTTGAVITSLTYAPFGEIIEATNSGGLSSHRRRQNDKYVDEISDIAYYGFRYYDKTSMTWTQGDPVYRFAPDWAKQSTPRRASLYQFSLNNPLRFLDPNGLDAVGVGQFFDHTDSNSVAGQGSALEGGGWGAFSEEGGTWDNALRDLVLMGIAKKRASQVQLQVQPIPEFQGDHGDNPYEPAFVSGIRHDTDPTRVVRRIADDASPYVPEITRTQVIVGVAVLAFAALDLPVVAFVVAMSQAKSHGDTAISIVTFGIGTQGKYGGKGSKISGRAPKSESCFTCGGDGGGYAHPKGYLSPLGGPEPICESCFVRESGGRRPMGVDMK